MRTLFGMALLSGVVLLLQVALTRIFSVAQFYHFAFLVISLALLGFGASGSLLAIWPRLIRQEISPWYAVGFAVTALMAYDIINHAAFDSYSIAWDSSQVGLLILNLVALAVPFAFAGALIGALLSSAAASAGRIYGANLIGSAVGAILAPVVIQWLGSEQAVVFCVVLAFLAALILARRQWIVTGISVAGLVVGVGLLVTFPERLELQPSPYKTLSHFRLNPDATIVETEQNAYSRLDVVESRTIHSAPGLSINYLGDIPPQIGLVIDAGNLLPVSQAAETSEGILNALPADVAYEIVPDAEVLLLGIAGGLDALVALANEAEQVTIIEPNRLIYDALTNDLREWAGLAGSERVTLLHNEFRVIARNTQENYDVVQLTLRDNYRPITSGAFTLTEDYTLTVDAFRAYFDLLDSDGVFVASRWLQEPPSESLRMLAIIIEALDVEDPLQHIVAFRNFQMSTFIVKPTPFTPEEVDTLLQRIEAMRYDLIIAPEMPDDMINQYAVLEEPVYHNLFLELATTPDRRAFYDDYPFEISPSTDNEPFFYHFFRWAQTPEVLENLGRRWQPFGGSGYFVLLALLSFAVLAALLFIILPITLRRRFRQALMRVGGGRVVRVLLYFTALGLAFLMVEVVLIQKYILVLGQPTLAIATVIGALLFFSGIGSTLSPRVPWRYALLALVVLLVVYSPLVGLFTSPLLNLSLAPRLVAVALLIAPVGLLLGMPFPKGVTHLQDVPDLVPWAWAANGSASVASAVLAVMIALSVGFGGVLIVGAALYLLAALLIW